MKAVVLARGVGRRMQAAGADAGLTPAQRAAAAAGLKSMMPVGGGRGRPFLDHVLGALADAGCLDVCLVVGPEHEAIREYYEHEGRPARIRLAFAIQPEATGTAHAVLAAEAFAGDDPFLVLNADNVYPADVLRALVDLDGPGLPVFERRSLIDESGFPADRVAAFALLEVEGGRLRRIVEKPSPALFDAAGPHALVSMNVWRFDRRIFGACRDVPRSVRGEYELPEAVGLALTRGIEFRAVPAGGAVLDLSRRADVAEVSRRLAAAEPRP
jgi:dTDP-glucose pyrophosphorylase